MSEVTQNVNFIIFKFKLHYLIGQNHDTIWELQSLYKAELNMISNGELSDPLNGGLTLVRL